MSRIRKAAVTAAFAYAQFGVAILAGIVLVPLTLHYVGARSWGLWLASGELLGYAGMADLGVLGVLPWMVAEADGRQDRDAMRRLVGHGVWVGLVVAVVYASLSTALWLALSSALRFSNADRAFVGPPFAVLVAIGTISHPFRVFRAALAGLQDASFTGALSVGQSIATVATTIVLLTHGYGLYALALGSGGPSFVASVIAIARLRAIAPDLTRGWTRPSLLDVRVLLTNGTGVWLGGIGWQLLAATNAIVISYLGHPEWVPVYSCTAKLSAMTTQLTWVLPDSGLVGLAQLYGERERGGLSRLRHVVLMLLRLHLLLAGGAACVLLAFNPAFVTIWVGPQFFGGLSLNALLAIGVVFSSLIHGLITTASVLGNRLQVGVVALVNGVVQTLLALALGSSHGLAGIAAACLIAGAITSVPAAIVLLRPVTALTVRHLARELIGPWLVRGTSLVVVSVVVGLFYRGLGLVLTGSMASVISMFYVWHMRPLYVGLPLDARWANWLVRIRLIPPPGVVPPSTAAFEQV
jgi:O-antigen/teichoic acid export membrane protein